MHQKGIIHRDLKLENIMVKEDAPFPIRPVIVDMGLARKISEKIAPANICGTVGYIAPEILNGQHYDYKCDIFSLGVVFHYM